MNLLKWMKYIWKVYIYEDKQSDLVVQMANTRVEFLGQQTVSGSRTLEVT